MAKKADKANPQEKARRALVKAQLKLEVAQQEHSQERVRGQQEVEKARVRAQKWLGKAAQRVERRAELVVQAEAALAAVARPARETEPASKQPVKRRRKSAADTPASPQAAADQVEKAQTAAAEPPGPVIVSQTIPSMQDSTGPSNDNKPDRS